MGIQQLPNDANSKLLEQMGTLGGLSFGGSSSAGNNLSVTTAEPLSANTTVNTMVERLKRSNMDISSMFNYIAIPTIIVPSRVIVSAITC